LFFKDFMHFRGWRESSSLSLKHTPPPYDFLTQLAAFNSPIASFLNEEMGVEGVRRALNPV
jgi:hypothetical protein